MSLLSLPEVALLGRAPYHRWLQIAFPVRQRTQFIYGCYLGEVACGGLIPDEEGKYVGLQLIQAGRQTTVGVPGKEIVVEPDWGYAFDPRCMMIDNALHKVLWHPWMVPIGMHTLDTQAWLRAHPEWIPKGYQEYSRQHPFGPIDLAGQTIYVTDEPTADGDQQAMTDRIEGVWGYKNEQQTEMALVVDLESA